MNIFSQKRSFTLVEVLISFMLLSFSLVLLLPPLSNAGKNIREQSARILVQSIADETINQLYAQIFQNESLKKERFEELFAVQEEELYRVHYTIIDVESKGKESAYAGLWMEMEVEHKAFPTARAKRNFYLCSKLSS